MDDVDAFLSSALPALKDEVQALQGGNAGPRMALWSHQDPVTLFGAAMTARGWDAIKPGFEWLASSFQGSGSYEFEVLGAGVSGDLAYIVGIEVTRVMVGQKEPVPYRLRVTTVFRREDGSWKVVHRHADPYEDSAADHLDILSGSSSGTSP